MPIKFRTGSTSANVVNVWVRVGGVNVRKNVYARVAGSNQLVWSPAGSWAASIIGNHSSYQVENGFVSIPVEVSIDGSAGPHTYGWSFISGGAGLTLQNVNNSTVSVESNGTDVTFSGTLRCIVTNTAWGNTASDTTFYQVSRGTAV